MTEQESKAQHPLHKDVGSRHKHVLVQRHLRECISSGKLAIGDMLPTEHELCTRFQCSRGTVRRALATLAKDGFIQSRRGSGTFVTPQGAASGRLIAVIVPFLAHGERSRFVHCLTLGLEQRGYKLVLGVTHHNTAKENRFIEEIAELGVAGVIKFPTSAPTVSEDETRALLRKIGLRYVIINDFWCDTREHNHVAFDECAAVELAVNHLTELGHVKIAFGHEERGQRTRAVTHLKHVLKNRGIEFGSHNVFFSAWSSPPRLEMLFGRNKLNPTAIITPYDVLALTFLRHLPELGMRVPKDISLVNLNGLPEESSVDLTTAVPPNELIVETALRILLEDYNTMAACQYLLKPDFHIGSTSAAARS